MNFNSLTFLCFFPLVLLLYCVLPKKLRPALLLAASYLFYMSWNAKLVFLILTTTAVSYLAGMIIEKYREKKALPALSLIVTLIVSLGFLFFFKYFNFVISSVNSALAAFGGEKTFSTLDLILPVGISFYTFQTLSYVIDVYRGKIKAERNFFYYALFVSFFPQLVAGPIERPDNLLPQLREHRDPKADDIRDGLKLMAIGFFKKIVLADGVASAVNAVYNSPDGQSGFSVILATLLFAVQIYGDFSGYTDIAIGAARMLGIRLMKNFDRPYTAQSVKEFWDRWHISLSSWFRDYLYIPLGGNRKGKARKMLNVFIVFLVSGIWHGAAWTFVLWGALHGLYRLIEELFYKPIKKFAEKKGAGAVFLRRLITFLLVTFAWIFFRANSVADLQTLLGSLASGWNADAISASLSSMGLGALPLCRIALSVSLLAVINRIMPDNTSIGEEKTAVSSSALTYVMLVMCVAVGWLMLLEHHEASSFIYFQF